ncbi:MAG: RrF2 family transcriptional regulator [Anaerolineae bacterium]
MKLTTRMRYGTRVMLELALHYEQGALSLGEIVQRQTLPERYVEALLGTLRGATLVQSVRGAAGGYLLGRPPGQITLCDIFEVLEGSEAFVPCTLDHSACDRRDTCVTQEVWARMYEQATEVLRQTTLADLVTRLQQRAEANAVSYVI